MFDSDNNYADFQADEQARLTQEAVNYGKWVALAMAAWLVNPETSAQERMAWIETCNDEKHARLYHEYTRNAFDHNWSPADNRRFDLAQ